MSKTLTIELPDSVVQRLKAFADDENIPLSELIANTLYVFAHETASMRAEDSSAQIQAIQKLRETIAKTNPPSTIEAIRTLGSDQSLSIQGKTQNRGNGVEEEYDVLLSLAGTLEIGTTDLGENHDRYIAEALEKELIPDE